VWLLLVTQLAFVALAEERSVGSTDLEAWQALYSATAGATWNSCADEFEDPCKCTKVVCATAEGDQNMKILQINLSFNNMMGGISATLLEMFESLEGVNFAGNLGLHIQGGAIFASKMGQACLDFNCTERSCVLPENWVLCSETELQGWRELFDNTGGTMWTECSQYRDSPCSCGLVVCDYATMAMIPMSVTRLLLSNNNLNGKMPDVTSVFPNLEKIRLAGNNLTVDSAHVLPDYDCIDLMGKCGSGDVDCSDLDLNLCAYKDIGAWQEFYDAMRDPNFIWRKCDGKRSDPCNCGGVSCTEDFEITEIRMKHNNLRGHLPMNALRRFSKLTLLELEDTLADPEKPNIINVAPGTPCINIPQCLSGDVTCFLGVGRTDYCNVTITMPIFPDTPSDIYESDWLVWQDFYSSTGGEQWNHCSENFGTPCSCDVSKKRRVICKNKRIKRIELRNNLLQLETLDFRELRKLPDLMDFLVNNPDRKKLNTAAASPCLSIPECQSEWNCKVPDPATFCHDTPAPTVAPTPFPTLSPTKSPTIGAVDLEAWQALYDATNGTHWAFCSEHRSSPCDCNESPARSVVCDSGNIIVISLQNNRLQGSTLPVQKFTPLSAFTTLRLDNGLSLTENLNTFTGYETGLCIDLPSCNTDWTCSFWDGAQLCSNTPPPSQFATRTPTSSFLDSGSLSFWHDLYDNTGGSNWDVACSRSSPCSCTNGFDKYVSCSDGHIVDLVLPNNNMIGELPFDKLRNSLPMLQRVVLSNSAESTDSENVFLQSGDCEALPACTEEFTLTCDFSNSGVQLCAAYAPTKSPTMRPSQVPTPAPTTASPTFGLPTLSPTSKPTVSPTLKPTVEARDVFVSIRFANGDYSEFNATKKGRMEQILSDTLSGKPQVVVLDILKGSVIVNFQIRDFEDPWSSSNSLSGLWNAMRSDERNALLPNGESEKPFVSFVSEESGTFPTPRPTRSPTDSDGPPGTNNNSTDTQVAEVNAVMVIGSVSGGVMGTAVLVYFVYRLKPKSQRELDRKTSWRIDKNTQGEHSQIKKAEAYLADPPTGPSAHPRLLMSMEDFSEAMTNETESTRFSTKYETEFDLETSSSSHEISKMI